MEEYDATADDFTIASEEELVAGAATQEPRRPLHTILLDVLTGAIDFIKTLATGTVEAASATFDSVDKCGLCHRSDCLATSEEIKWYCETTAQLAANFGSYVERPCHYPDLAVQSGESVALSPPAISEERRSLRAIWKSIGVFADRHDRIICFTLAVVIVGALYASAFTALSIWRHNGRTQAVQRAMRMDGEIYTIKKVDWNWIGDTLLYLNNERGEDAGWVVIHNNNPLTSAVNPLYLSLLKPLAPLPFPMKVRAHFRAEAWENTATGRSYENYTGSFVDFEQLGSQLASRSAGRAKE